MSVNTVFVLLALTISQVPAVPAVPAVSLAEVPAVYPSGFETPEGSGSRIVSGWDAQPGQHPHQVSLRMISALGLATGCGGSVVHRSWVVTAAHCTAGQLTVIVRAGLVNINNPEVVQETQETYNYPTFNVNTPLVVQTNDISLIKLQQPLVYSSNLRSIRIQPSADAYRDYNAVVLYASGFGRTWTGGPTSDHLQWVFLRGVSNPSCSEIFTTLITQNSICATFHNVTSQSICQGDSGGPLVNVEADGTPTLVGVTSFVAGGIHGCHSGIPGGFTRPGPFHSWFTQVTGIDFNNLVEEEEVELTTTAVPETTVYITTEESESPDTTVVTTTSAPNTTVTVTTPSTPSTTTPSPPSTTTPPTPEEEEESEEIDDPEIADLLKRLEVKVKVKVKLSKYLNKKRD
ncbi:serine protease 1-like [Aricia agestis]|uniref:serine protease 1-like n=1 Tax=Aricia agestis TaxID=91739 RepID=UPI001C20B162|nr:serine protease 1-like [Aricia agestis]